MRSKIISFVLFFVTVCALSSCLNDDTSNVTLYDDTAITSFSLGTINYERTLTSKSGKDSIVKRTIEGTNYKCFIDQSARRIWNADSLPFRTDMKHLLINVTTKNGGTALLKKIGNDSLTIINASDSLDFSVPREITVYSNSGLNKATYTVNLTCHQEATDSLVWYGGAAIDQIAAYKSVKAQAFKGKMYVLGAKEGGKELISSDLSDGKNWAIAAPALASLAAEASMVADDETLIIASGDQLYYTSGSEWAQISTPVSIKTLIGKCGKELFALSNDGDILMSLDMGASWTVDRLDADKSFLPVSEINAVSAVTRTNNDINRIVMVGSRNDGDSKKQNGLVVWSKIVEDDSARDLPWAYQEWAKGNTHVLPNLENLTLTSYKYLTLAIGGKCKSDSSVKPYGVIYASNDCGITWHPNDLRFYMPKDFAGESAAIAADSNGIIWIIATGSGKVWKGHINE